MISNWLVNEHCKWCGQALARSFLTRVTLGVEKNDALLYPVMCICGGITVIGAEVLGSHSNELIGSGKAEKINGASNNNYRHDPRD